MSAYHIAANRLRVTRILDVKAVSPTMKVLVFKDKLCSRARPGQFMMLWIPGVDEIPLSVLDTDKSGEVSVVVKKVGEATLALHEKNVDELVGVRGPFGNSFNACGGKVLMVGGGTGIAPLFLLTRNQASKVSKLIFVMGAKTKNELLFKDKIEALLQRTEDELIASTEDGSCGTTGLCTQPLEELLSEDRFDMIFTCGPEPMMKKVFELAEKHETLLEASLERLMRCAIGLCGTCAIGKYRVCKDGPVFTSEQLRQITGEFGVSKLGFDGRRALL